MSKLWNKRLLAAKIETTYGTDSVPTGANAMLVKNLEVTPLAAELVSRDLIKPYFGASEQLLADKLVNISFEIEMQGAGVVGKVPAYDPLLRSCGFARTIQTATITAAIASEVVTVTRTAHGYLTGDVVAHAGFTDTACNIEAEITRIDANTYTYEATGAVDDATADGSPVINTGVRYLPLSENFESVSMYFNLDGVLHRSVGARGNVEFGLTVKQIPFMRFSYTGLYAQPVDAAAFVPDFTGFQIPDLANTQNTPGFSLFAYSALLESFSLNMTNDVQKVTLIGEESVKIVGRQPSGNLVFEAPELAAKNYFELVEENTSGPLTLSHGVRNGYKFLISCPAVNLGNPAYQESTGVAMLNAPFTANPTSAGNDEIEIIVR